MTKSRRGTATSTNAENCASVPIPLAAAPSDRPPDTGLPLRPHIEEGSAHQIIYPGASAIHLDTTRSSGLPSKSPTADLPSTRSHTPTQDLGPQINDPECSDRGLPAPIASIESFTQEATIRPEVPDRSKPSPHIGRRDLAEEPSRIKMETGSAVWMSTHSRDAVNPYIQEDLKDAAKVPLDSYSKAVFGDQSKLRLWERELHEMDLFHDPQIQDGLALFCHAEREDERYAPFVDMCHHIMDRARGNLTGVGNQFPVDDCRFADSSSRPVQTIQQHGTLGAERKPDILGLRQPAADKVARGERVEWKDILVIVELKKRSILSEKLKETIAQRAAGKAATNDPKDTSHVPDDQLAGILDVKDMAAEKGKTTVRESRVGVAIQVTSYALEKKSCTHGTWVFCLAMIIDDDRISLWYYDASGIVYTTEHISVIEHFELFAATTVAFATLTEEGFGMLPASVITPAAPLSSHFPLSSHEGGTFKLPDTSTGLPMALELDKSIFSAYSLVGRGTFLYRLRKNGALCDDLGDAVAKFSYQVVTRKKEEDLVSRARAKGVSHMPLIHRSADLWKLSDGVRDLFYDYDNHRVEYEDRSLRLIIYKAYYPIQELFKERVDLVLVMADHMLDCLHDLFYSANILHRDISVNNIMWELQGDNVSFTLIDHDMAVLLPNESNGVYIASSKNRTGTLPFMSPELILDAWKAIKKRKNWSPIHHRLHHEFQSLFLVCLWCLLAQLKDDLEDDEREEITAFLRAWEKGESLVWVAYIKRMVFRDRVRDLGFIVPTTLSPFLPWLNAWTKVFVAADAAKVARDDAIELAKSEHRDPGRFDEETLGGTISRDVLKRELAEAVRTRSAKLTQEEIGKLCVTQATNESRLPIPEASGRGATAVSRTRPRAARTAKKQKEDKTIGLTARDTAMKVLTMEVKGKKAAGSSRGVRSRRTRDKEPLPVVPEAEEQEPTLAGNARKVRGRKRVREATRQDVDVDMPAKSRKRPKVTVNARGMDRDVQIPSDNAASSTGIRSRLRPRRTGVVYKY